MRLIKLDMDRVFYLDHDDELQRIYNGEDPIIEPIIVPNNGVVYWDNDGELSGDKKAIKFIQSQFKKAERDGVHYEYLEHGRVYNAPIEYSDIEDENYDAMIDVLKYFGIDVPNYLYGRLSLL